MGSCVSVRRNPDSVMKHRLSFGSKTNKLLIPSPIKDKPVNDDRLIPEDGLKSRSVTTFRDFGSKEETYFDSQAWLDSDCEDDFFSVNGDFTPSRGSTPVHQSISMGTPRVNKALFEDRTPYSKSEPSPTNKKKKLADLFRESRGGDQDVDDQIISGNQNVANGKMEVKPTILDLPPKSSNGTPYVSGANSVCSSDRTPNGDFKPQKEKSIRSVQCCIPSLVSCRSYSEWKKKMSPVHSRG